MSSGKFSASKRRAEARQEAALEAQGDRAYAELTQQLEGFVSPRVGTMALRSSKRTNQDEWLEGQEEEAAEEDALMDTSTTEAADDAEAVPGSPAKRQKTPPGRASTPIISNSSKKKRWQELRASANTGGDMELEEDESEPLPVETPVQPPNVESPWAATMPTTDEITTQSKPYRLGATTTPRRATATGSSHRDYLRYYNALLAYTQGKRRLQERTELELQSRNEPSAPAGDAMEEDDDDDMLMPFNPVDEDLVRQETVVELEFLKALNGLCWDRDPTDPATLTRELDPMSSVARKEGNFWLLLFSLRELGLPCLVWSDDEASQRQNEQAVSVYLQTLASNVYATPLEVYHDLHNSPERPLSIQRQQAIFSWLQQCFDKVLPRGVTRPKRTTNIVTTSTFVNEGLPSTDKDAELLHASLALILAGRLEDALQLMRESGIPMRAALWSGGKPYGYEQYANHDKKELDRVPTGNTRRALWRRSMWAHSEKLKEQASSNATVQNQDEAAISAILAGHLRDGLVNASLRTWEKGLLLIFSCVLGRLEDDVFNRHNNERRLMRPPFPGTEYKTKELEQLRATGDFASMSEAKIVNVLVSTPFDEMRGDDLVTQVTMSVLVGRSAFVDFVDKAPIDPTDETGLRFLTHLVLYVDSLGAGSTPLLLEGLAEYKVAVVIRYLEHLASRDDLWHMIVLYASKLPDSLIMDHLPPLLEPITKRDERELTVQQLGDLLTTRGLDLEILRRLVRTMLVQGADGDMVTEDSPTSLDVEKMKAIQWLCFSEKHYLEALICTNTLLRQFLLMDKIASARLFVHDFLPNEVSETAIVGDTAEPETDRRVVELSRAQAENLAYQAYLKAQETAEAWREVLAETSAVTQLVDDSLVDTRVLNPTEVGIASAQEKRKFLQEKQEACKAVIRIAEQAGEALRSVLEFSGGFLLVADEEIMEGTEEEMERRQQLQKLRVHLLPGVVLRYHEVCVETAAWLSKSLDDGVERVGGTAESVLSSLAESTQADDKSPFSPQYWTGLAMEVAELVVTQEFDILSAFGTAELHDLLTRFSDTAVANMLYDSSQREKFITKT